MHMLRYNMVKQFYQRLWVLSHFYSSYILFYFFAQVVMVMVTIDEGFCFSLVYIRLTLEINNKDNDCFLFLLYFECIFYFKIIKTERLYNEDQITYEHEVFYFKMNTDLGGWAHEDKSYLINANEVLKELNKPKIKKVGRSRKGLHFWHVKNTMV